MKIKKLIRDITQEGITAKSIGNDNFSILKELGGDKSLSSLRFEAFLGRREGDNSKQNLYEQYGEIRRNILKVAHNPLKGVCSLDEGRRIRAVDKAEMRDKLSKIGVNDTNFMAFISDTDPDWGARGKESLGLDDVSDECLREYMKKLNPF